MADITIETVQTATDEVRELIAALDRTLALEYLPEQQHGLSVEALFEPHVRFFVARLSGSAVGCCGVALSPEFAELKRMYVRPEARGRGIAQALLARVERETSANGISSLRLETGTRQFAAMRVYERAGFRPCPAFGEYTAMPPEAIATSLFYEKQLTTEARSANGAPPST